MDLDTSEFWKWLREQAVLPRPTTLPWERAALQQLDDRWRLGRMWMPEREPEPRRLSFADAFVGDHQFDLLVTELRLIRESLEQRNRQRWWACPRPNMPFRFTHTRAGWRCEYDDCGYIETQAPEPLKWCRNCAAGVADELRRLRVLEYQCPCCDGVVTVRDIEGA